jgi:hypothetical protein
MTLKAKLILTSMLAMFAVGVVTTATANAVAQWQVEGKPLETGHTKELEEVQTSEGFTLNTTIAKTKIKVTCKETSFAEGFIEGSNGGGIHSLKLSGCTVNGSLCKVEPITFQPVALELVAQVKEAVVIKPKEKGSELLFTLAIKECAAEGSFNVTGQLKANAPGGEEQLKSHTWEFSETSGSSVKVGKEAATIFPWRIIWWLIFHIIWGNT